MLWMIRMSQWLRHPPSLGRVKLYAAIVAGCIVIGALEHYGLWPDWAQIDTRPRRLLP